MTKKRIIGAESIGTFIDGDLRDKTYISLKPNCFCSYTSIKNNDGHFQRPCAWPP